MDKQDFIKESEQTVKNKICLNICVCVDFDRDYSALYCFPRTNIDLVYLFMKNQNENKKSNRIRSYSLPYWLRRFSIHTHSLFPLNASIVASFCRARMNYTNQSLYACFLFRFDYTIYFTVCHVSINFFHANERVALRHIFFYFVARTKFLVSTIVCIICHQSCFFSVWLMIIQSNKKKTHHNADSHGFHSIFFGPKMCCVQLCSVESLIFVTVSVWRDDEYEPQALAWNVK